MQWVVTEPELRVAPRQIKGALLRSALASVNGVAGLRGLGLLLLETHDFEGAVMALSLCRRLDPGNFRDWSRLAAALVGAGRHEEALEVCAAAPADEARLTALRGHALEGLGRHEEAGEALAAAAIETGDAAALAKALEILAGRNDPHRLLALCSRLPPALANGAYARAYRAIGLSQAGRTAEARMMVDADRHVARVRFTPPAAFGGIERFNAALEEQILAQGRGGMTRDGFSLFHSPPISGVPEFDALHQFIREAMEAFIAEIPARGLDAVMGPPPRAANLHTANLVLTDDGSNGQHIHGLGYLSAVYHVRVPAEVTEANDDRGCLMVGACDAFTGGHTPCWEVRALKPLEGWLTIMPSHIFHDVAPTRTGSPRVSVAADMRPVEPAGAS